jgi:Ca2+-binding EF-hand superfamily protein/tRNA A-37 threonylcarbamoyl transferase component Bud32
MGGGLSTSNAQGDGEGAASTRSRQERFRNLFTNEEIVLLQQTFDALAEHGTNKMIDRVTFGRLFRNMTGILSDRLFATFDSKGHGAIDRDEFIAGLGLLARGSVEDKIDFLFRVYDLSSHGYVTRFELTMMLSSVVAAAFEILDATGGGDKFSKELSDALNRRVKELVDSAFTIKTAEVDKLSKDEFKQWVLQHEENLDIFEQLFGMVATPEPEPEPMPEPEPCPEVNKKPMPEICRRFRDSLMIGTDRKPLTFEGIIHSPGRNGSPIGRVKQALSAYVGKDLSSRSKSETFVRNGAGQAAPLSKCGKDVVCQSCRYKICSRYCCTCGRPVTSSATALMCGTCDRVTESQLRMKHCMNCGVDLAPIDYPIEPIYSRLPPPDESSNTMQGHLYKVGSLFKHLKLRYYILKDNFLYCFHNEYDLSPSGVIALEGMFVEPVDHSNRSPKMAYGIEMTISPETEIVRNLYATTEKSRNQWMRAIRHAARQFVLEDYYVIGDELGAGKFSKVHLCVHKVTLKKYAVKIIDKTGMTASERDLLRTEIAVLQLVNHPHIVHLKNVFETRSRIYIIMTLVEGGDLFQRLTLRHRFDEATAKRIIKNLLEALQYLHERGIVHRDLKLENIMMTSRDSDTDIQVADFGLSKFAAPEEIMRLPCGTLTYVAPEVLQMNGYGREVDLWNVGVILYVLLRGRLPFESRHNNEIIEKTLRAQLFIERDAAWDTISMDAKNMIRKLICSDPKKRLTVQKALEEPWLDELRNGDTAADAAVSAHNNNDSNNNNNADFIK